MTLSEHIENIITVKLAEKFLVISICLPKFCRLGFRKIFLGFGPRFEH